MKPIIDFLEAHPVTGAAVLSSLPLVFPKVRAWIKAQWSKRGADKREFHQKLNTIASDVKIIKTEVQYSGETTTKQEVELLKNRQHLDLWRSNRPAMELDGDANALHVSETLCRLFGVSTPTDLYRRNWMRFVSGDSVDDFIAVFADCVKFQSACDFVFHLQKKDGSDLGRWKILTSPVSPTGHPKTLYSGYFLPIDAAAKEVAAALHWSK